MIGLNECRIATTATARPPSDRSTPRAAPARRQASAATASSSSVTPPRISGSRELSVTHCDANVSNADTEQHARHDADADVPGRARQHHAGRRRAPSRRAPCECRTRWSASRRRRRRRCRDRPPTARARAREKTREQLGHQLLLRVLRQVRDPALEIAHAHDLLLAVDAHELRPHVAQHRQRRHVVVRTRICVNICIFSVYGT